MNLKIKYKDNVLNLLETYRDFDYEVGGILYGKRFFKNYEIDIITFKKGEKFSIQFLQTDIKIYESNNKSLIGTWHSHPFSDYPTPSSIDISQWKKWNKKYIHIISSKKAFRIFNYKGEKIYEKAFKGFG